MKYFTMSDLETRCKTSSEKIVSRTDFSRRQLATAFSPLKCLWAFSCHLKSLERRNKSLILLDSIYEIIPKWWKYRSRDGKLVIAGDMMIWCKTWRQRDSWCLNIVISLSGSLVRRYCYEALLLLFSFASIGLDEAVEPVWKYIVESLPMLLGVMLCSRWGGGVHTFVIQNKGSSKR